MREPTAMQNFIKEVLITTYQLGEQQLYVFF